MIHALGIIGAIVWLGLNTAGGSDNAKHAASIELAELARIYIKKRWDFRVP
jgi:hypothetical protein